MMENRSSSCHNNYRPVVNQNMNSMNRSVTSTVVPAQKPCRKELMDTINQCSFAMNDANLFLNTHPYDTEALAYFQLHREHRIKAVKEYAKYYAPLAIDYAENDKTPWSWVTEPWPWEGVDC